MKKFTKIYRLVFVVLVAVAIGLDLRGGAYVLNYYTVMSNIACVVFFAAALIWNRKSWSRAEAKTEIAPRSGTEAPTRTAVWSRTEAAVVFCIAITGLIYAVMLAPADWGTPRFWTYSNLMLHYISPLAVLTDWLIFAPKGTIKPLDPLRWLLMPLGYFGYILVRAPFAGEIGTTGSAYPYDFVDPAAAGGWGPMLLGVLWIALGMAALAYAIYLIDRLLSRKQQLPNQQ